MLKSKYYLFLMFCVGFFFTSKATHNRAGEITYKWLFGYTYEIKITTYTNIGTNTADRCENTLHFGDGTSAVVRRSNGPIGPCSPACDGVPINANIKLNEYVTTHTYSGPGNYLISTEDPNRTGGIINIPNSVNQVFYIESLLVIPTFGTGKNTSSIFNFLPLDSGYVNQCFYHNPGASDIDGDSISYELTYCRGIMGTNNVGYTYPASGNGIFSLDSITGTLTWCTPQMPGDYNVATIVKEWRKDNNGTYFLVGYVLRDAQFAISSFTGINETGTFDDFVTVFPNPVNDNLSINFNQTNNELFTIELMDVCGRKIKTFLNNDAINKQFNFSMRDINNGIYFLKITGNHNTVITKKIIKQ